MRGHYRQTINIIIHYYYAVKIVTMLVFFISDRLSKLLFLEVPVITLILLLLFSVAVITSLGLNQTCLKSDK